MYTGKLVFAQLMGHLPLHSFRRCVARYDGNHKVQRFTCLDQYLCMAFAQLTYRESLRDVEACLRAQRSKLYHMGISTAVSRSTIADANETRDWRIHADFAQSLIAVARKLYAEDDFGVELSQTVYAFDATTIDLCLTVFPWARFQTIKSAIKLHTLLDLRGNIPSFLHITDGKGSDYKSLDVLPLEAGSFYIMDRGYIDFARLDRFNRTSAFFVIRQRANNLFRRVYSHPVDTSSGLICDQTIRLTGKQAAISYPHKLRRVAFRDLESGKRLAVLTNNFDLPALTLAQLYRCRWQVELFFKWIKQHLRIKAFYGTSENAVRSQIWIAVSVYVLIAIVKKRLAIKASLYTMLQVLSLTPFEKMPMDKAFFDDDYSEQQPSKINQLNLFD
jgi:Domain of unknown function (DUF4372)/Transposase DDE domain